MPRQPSPNRAFTDITARAASPSPTSPSPDKKYILESMSGGVALFDFDKDGLLDIYLVNAPTVATAGDPRSARSELWRNAGDGTFVDVTDKAGVGYPGWGMGVVDRRLRQRRLGGPLRHLLRPQPPVSQQRRRHVHRRRPRKRASAIPRWSTGAAFADYDNDGWLDLFVANYVDCELDALPEFGKGKILRVQGHRRCSAARAGCPAPATRSTATTATAPSPTSRAKAGRRRPDGTLRPGRRVERLRRRRPARSVRRQRRRPELPLQEQRRRHLHRRRPRRRGRRSARTARSRARWASPIGDYDHRGRGASS